MGAEVMPFVSYTMQQCKVHIENFIWVYRILFGMTLVIIVRADVPA